MRQIFKSAGIKEVTFNNHFLTCYFICDAIFDRQEAKLKNY